MATQKELSVFVDESGSFDSSVVPSRFYIVSFVFHDQREALDPHLAEINARLNSLGFPGLCVHTGPLIRREENFRSMDFHLRRQLFFRLLAFALHAPIRHHSFSVDKRYATDPAAIARSLSLQISEFIAQNKQRLSTYDRIKIYYDNGQSQVRRILQTAFSALPATFTESVKPERYRLFQAADLVCAVELLNLKLHESIPLTRSEERFFPSLRDLKKNVLRPLARLRV